MILGCDPEIFLVDAAGALISAIDKIGGTKDFPRPLPIGEGFAVQEDNVALEFNIPPARDSKQFVTNINKVKEFLSAEIKTHGLAFSHLSSGRFSADQLVDHRALEFGCEPDFNAWTKRRNPRPKANDPSLRSCGGHIHVGERFESDKNKYQFIKFMDLAIGVPSILMDNGEERKKLYGKAGACRLKPYGVEYRTPSNFWVFDDSLIEWVWENTQLALHMFKEGKVDIDHEREQIVHAINENNKHVAGELIARYDIPCLTL